MIRAGFASDHAFTNSGRNADKIDCITLEGDTLSRPLLEGETTFIIAFPTAAALDRFTFVNENAAAEGEMKIAVSNERLPAQSPKWIDVNGNVAFARKRLFQFFHARDRGALCKLSFHVEKRRPHRGFESLGCSQK